jgi:PKD repeat protein
MGNGNIFSNNNPNFSYDFINTENYIQNYAVNLTVSNNFNCTDSVNKSVSVCPNVTANFSSDTVGCSPKEIIFYNTSSGSSGFIWDFGDSTILTETNPTHIYENNGYYNIILIAKNELCSDTSNRTISVTNNSKGNIIIHLLQTHIILTMEIFIKIMGLTIFFIQTYWELKITNLIFLIDGENISFLQKTNPLDGMAISKENSVRQMYIFIKYMLFS